MTKMKNKPYAVILGLSVNGLSVVRSLGRRGISVIALECKKPSGTPYSRYIRKLVCVGHEPSKDRLLETILNIGKQHGAPMFLLPTNDFFALFVAEHRKELSRYFSFTVADYKLLESVTNKRLLHQIVEKHNIPHPEAFFVANAEQLNSILAKVKYPCYLKPVYSHIFRRKYTSVKVLTVENEAELLSYWKETSALNIEVMIQEIIPGGDDTLFEVAAFFDNLSRPIAICTARKIRQLPIGAGDGSARVAVENRFLEDIAARLLQAIGYVGPCETEFKWDMRDKQYKIIEINPRTVIGQELFSRGGVDIPYMAYEYTMNNKVASPARYKVGLKWLCFENDFSAFLQARRMKRLTFSEWFESIKDARVFAFFAWDDPLPFIVQLWKQLQRYMNVFGRRVAEKCLSMTAVVGDKSK